MARAVGMFFVVAGAAVGALGASMLGWSLLAPTQPPPSLNEGHAFGCVFGLVIGFSGLLLFGLGKGIRDGGKTKDS